MRFVRAVVVVALLAGLSTAACSRSGYELEATPVWMPDGRIYTISYGGDSEAVNGRLVRAQRGGRTEVVKMPAGCYAAASLALSRFSDQLVVGLLCHAPMHHIALYAFSPATGGFDLLGSVKGMGVRAAVFGTATEGFLTDGCGVLRFSRGADDKLDTTSIDLGAVARPECRNGYDVDMLSLVGGRLLFDLVVEVHEQPGDDEVLRAVLSHNPADGTTRVVKSQPYDVFKNFRTWTVTADGRTLYVAGGLETDETAGIWKVDVADGRAERIVAGRFYELALSPDGRTLFAVSADEKRRYQYFDIASAG